MFKTSFLPFSTAPALGFAQGLPTQNGASESSGGSDTGFAGDAYSANWNRSGLVVRPRMAQDLPQLVEHIIATAPAPLPNKRVVVDICHLGVQSYDVSDPTRQMLQGLADLTDTTIHLRALSPAEKDQIIPTQKREADALGPALLGMPGMGLQLVQRVALRQQLRQELRLELSLELRMELRQELHQVQAHAYETEYDDLWDESHVPGQFFEASELISEMPPVREPLEYLAKAQEALELIRSIYNPTFRMMAAGYLAEELAHLPSLQHFAKNIYSTEFRRSLEATPPSEQAALTLAVAASKLKSGIDRNSVQHLVTRALKLASEHKSEWRGRDMRTFETIIRDWPTTFDEVRIAKEWIDQFVQQETWHPKQGDLVDTEFKEAELEDDESIVEAIQLDPSEESANVVESDRLHRSFRPAEKEYLRSRLLHRAMVRMVEEEGLTDATFETFMHLAAHDPWEETAAVAYQLLAPHAPFRDQLRNALPNFSDEYYRLKATWFLDRDSRENAQERWEQAQRHLEDSQFEPLIRSHENFAMGFAVGGDDPAIGLLPELQDFAVPIMNTASEIEAWAQQTVDGLVEESEIEGSDAPISDSATRAASDNDTREHEELKEREEERAREIAKDAARRRHEQKRLGSLYSRVGRVLLRLPAADNEETRMLQNAALEYVSLAGSPEGLAFFMAALPSNLSRPISDAAHRVRHRTLGSHPYYNALAKVLLIRPSLLGQDLMSSIRDTIEEYLEISLDEDGVSNAEVIEHLTFLAREFEPLQNSSRRLLTVARKRLKLYRDKIVALKAKAGAAAVEEVDEYSDSPDEVDATETGETIDHDGQLQVWQDLYDQGQAHILASTPFDANKEERLIRRIEKLARPAHIVLALRRRAEFLANDREHLVLAIDYMKKAITKLSDIGSQSARVGIAMELYDDLLRYPIFKEQQPLLVENIGHAFSASELTRLNAHRTRVEQPNWFAGEELAKLLSRSDASAELLGQFTPSRQLGKLLSRSDVTPTQKAELITGHLKNGPYQAAFGVLRNLLEAEEKKTESPHLAPLIVLYQQLLDSRDRKAKDYLRERKKRLLKRVSEEVEATPLRRSDWHWIGLFLKYGEDKDLTSLLAVTSLPAGDRLTLVQQLSAQGLIPAAWMTIYNHLSSLDKAHLFFEMIDKVKRALPGVEITERMIEDIVNDPRVKENDDIDSVISEWGNYWDDFDNIDDPETRIHMLATNDVLAAIYYDHESKKYNFGNQYLDFPDFLSIVRLFDSTDYQQDHTVIQRYEEALNRTRPTRDDEKGDSLELINEIDDLNDDEKAFFQEIVNATNPLTEAQLSGIREISQRSEHHHLEDLLPANQQIIYRLYFGETPIEGVGRFHQTRRFVKRFSPAALDKAMVPFELGTQFRLAYYDLLKLFYTQWSLREIESLIVEQAVSEDFAAQVRTELNALMDQNLSLEDYAAQVRRIHARLIAKIDGLDLPKARGKMQRMRKEYFDKQYLPQLVTEKSHVLIADAAQIHSVRARTDIEKRSFHDIYPALDAFREKALEATPRKTQIAQRLHLSQQWASRAGEKAMVEMELLADLLEIDDKLRESYFLPIREALQYQAHARQEQVEETYDLSAVSSKGRFEIRHVQKKDILTYIRIGDFRPCCIASDGGFFKSTVPGFLKDKMTQVFAIYDPDTRKAIGHMIGHLGLSGEKEMPTYFLNGLYLRTQYRGEAQDNAALDILNEFSELSGIEVNRHGMTSYPDLTRRPPAHYTVVANKTVRLQSIVDKDGKPIPLYNDLDFDGARVNQDQETTHYHRRVRPEPLS